MSVHRRSLFAYPCQWQKSKSEGEHQQDAKHRAATDTAHGKIGDEPGHPGLSLAPAEGDRKVQWQSPATLGKAHGADPYLLTVLQDALIADGVARQFRRAREIFVAEIRRSAIRCAS